MSYSVYTTVARRRYACLPPRIRRGSAASSSLGRTTLGQRGHLAAGRRKDRVVVRDFRPPCRGVVRNLIVISFLCPATSTPSSFGIYPVFFAVQGTKSYPCPGCNSSAYARNGSVDVAAFGLLPNNWTYVASWDSIWPTLGGANGGARGSCWKRKRNAERLGETASA